MQTNDERFFQLLEEQLLQVDPKTRIDWLEAAIDRLQFELRLQQLQPNQLEHLCDESLRPAERARLAQCKTEAERAEYVETYARARYFRRCAWINYLNGVTDVPPCKPVFETPAE